MVQTSEGFNESFNYDGSSKCIAFIQSLGSDMHRLEALSRASGAALDIDPEESLPASVRMMVDKLVMSRRSSQLETLEAILVSSFMMRRFDMITLIIYALLRRGQKELLERRLDFGDESITFLAGMEHFLQNDATPNEAREGMSLMQFLDTFKAKVDPRILVNLPAGPIIRAIARNPFREDYLRLLDVSGLLVSIISEDDRPSIQKILHEHPSSLEIVFGPLPPSPRGDHGEKLLFCSFMVAELLSFISKIIF